MTDIKVYNMSGSQVGTMELNDSVFGVEYKESLIHQAVVTRLANERQGTKSTLTRTEVRGGGAKPWRQKGTGRARQGSIRAPQWIKGGVAFRAFQESGGRRVYRHRRIEGFRTQNQRNGGVQESAQSGQDCAGRNGQRRHQRHPRGGQPSQAGDPAACIAQHLRSRKEQ